MAEEKPDSIPQDEGEAQEQPQAEPSSTPSDEWLEGALGRLADAGKLFGSPGAPTEQPQRSRAPAPQPTAPAPSTNVREEVTKVLQERDEERQQKEKEEGIAAQLSELRKALPKKKHWFFDPFSPWGG